MRLQLYQVDAFTKHRFAGNPAAIVPLQTWLDDAVLQSIAAENNLSETAFFVREKQGIHLRWFTPTTEVDLCGHATLAAAWVLFEELSYQGADIHFRSKSGALRVSRDNLGLTLDFPAVQPKSIDIPEHLLNGLGLRHSTAYPVFQADDIIVILETEQQVKAVMPNFDVLARIPTRGVIVTALAEDANIDFVSRWFGPQTGVNEDPVTGSAHTWLTPLWAKRLNKTRLSARQISSRGGELRCQFKGDRVLLTGQAVTYLRGEIEI